MNNFLWQKIHFFCYWIKLLCCRKVKAIFSIRQENSVVLHVNERRIMSGIFFMVKPHSSGWWYKMRARKWKIMWTRRIMGKVSWGGSCEKNGSGRQEGVGWWRRRIKWRCRVTTFNERLFGVCSERPLKKAHKTTASSFILYFSVLYCFFSSMHLLLSFILFKIFSLERHNIFSNAWQKFALKWKIIYWKEYGRRFEKKNETF